MTDYDEWSWEEDLSKEIEQIVVHFAKLKSRKEALRGPIVDNRYKKIRDLMEEGKVKEAQVLIQENEDDRQLELEKMYRDAYQEFYSAKISQAFNNSSIYYVSTKKGM